MKKAFSVIVTACVFAFAGCEKAKDDVNKLTEFDIAYSSDITIPGGTYLVGDSVNVTTPEISTGSASKFASENTASSLVSEIKFTKFRIFTGSGNLDNLKSFRIYIKTTNLGDVMIASKSSIPAGTTSILTDLNNVNIKEFIFKDKIQFRIVIVWSAGSTGNKQIGTEETVHVKATLIK
jgi:hypothetical protein